MKLVLLFAVLVYHCNAWAKPTEFLQWKVVSFVWPSEEAKIEAIENKDYIPENNLPLGLAKWKDKLFVTFPRWKSGVAATITYVDLKTANKSAPVIPYPNWNVNTLPKANEKPEEHIIVSTFRIKVDVCDRLWIMDTGIADILGNSKQIAPTSIIIYDLNTDKLIRKYNLKKDDIKGHDSVFPNIVVDVVSNECDKAFAYLPDMGGNGLVIYSFSENNSWRVKHNYFHFDPLSGNILAGGVKVQWSDGIFGLALGPVHQDGFRTVYFHALASTNEFSVNSRVLKNRTLATDPNSYDLFKCEGSKGVNSQSGASVFDEKLNVLFFTQLNKDAVACWNPRISLHPSSVCIVAQDHEQMIFTNDITIDDDRNLWILSDKMPTFLYQTLDLNDTNYRILKAPLDDIVKGTPCELI